MLLLYTEYLQLNNTMTIRIEKGHICISSDVCARTDLPVTVRESCDSEDKLKSRPDYNIQSSPLETS